MSNPNPESMEPRVFVSHASEDKDRFVLGFARRLRENGVDAWLDQWEMKPGDTYRGLCAKSHGEQRAHKEIDLHRRYVTGLADIPIFEACHPVNSMRT
jgi:hypothetical protein